MSHRRVSHSLLDPLLAPLVPALYRLAPLPRRLPPELIVLCGHLLALLGAVGFALTPHLAWAGLLAAAGVLGNHVADMLDGTHARRTGQCRNGGELLDHFTDPLSFAAWMIGLALAAGRPLLGTVCVVLIYATALVTSIRAKMLGEFTLARFGPTEFKAMLFLFALVVAGFSMWMGTGAEVVQALRLFLWTLVAVGILQLVAHLVRAVRDVNARGPRPDDSEWVRVRCRDKS